MIVPSTHEGFCLPLLEAQSCGTPVICSDIPVLCEVAGDAALFFPPDDIGPALERICFDEPLRLGSVKAGRKRAPQFMWQKAAERTLDVLRSVLVAA